MSFFQAGAPSILSITICGMFSETYFKLVLQFWCRRYSYLKIHGQRYAKDTLQSGKANRKGGGGQGGYITVGGLVMWSSSCHSSFPISRPPPLHPHSTPHPSGRRC